MDRPDYKVVGDRKLHLINAIAKGSAFPGFIYNSESGSSAPLINLIDHDQPVPFYFNGGPYFDFFDSTSSNPTEITGAYLDGRASIVTGRFGKGKVVLSGVHFEFDPSDKRLPLKPDVKSVLLEHNAEREMFIFQILAFFDIPSTTTIEAHAKAVDRKKCKIYSPDAEF